MLDLGISGSVTGTARPTGNKRSGSVPKLPAIRDAGSSEINLSGRSSGSGGRGVLSGMVSKSAAGVDVMDLKIAKLKSQSNEIRANTAHSNAVHAAGGYMGDMGVSGANFEGNTVGGGMSMGAPTSGGGGMAMSGAGVGSAGAGMNTRQGDIVFDSNAFKGVESNHASVPDRKPKGMQRAKKWTSDVENMFRFQLAGWRDVHEYMSVHTHPARWEEVGFVRCLQNKAGNFMYFRQCRECEDKHLAKVKLYTY
jgi:hypothetical protein